MCGRNSNRWSGGQRGAVDMHLQLKTPEPLLAMLRSRRRRRAMRAADPVGSSGRRAVWSGRQRRSDPLGHRRPGFRCNCRAMCRGGCAMRLSSRAVRPLFGAGSADACGSCGGDRARSSRAALGVPPEAPKTAPRCFSLRQYVVGDDLVCSRHDGRDARVRAGVAFGPGLAAEAIRFTA